MFKECVYIDLIYLLNYNSYANNRIIKNVGKLHLLRNEMNCYESESMRHLTAIV